MNSSIMWSENRSRAEEGESWLKDYFSLYLEGVLLPIIAIFGIVGIRNLVAD